MKILSLDLSKTLLFFVLLFGCSLIANAQKYEKLTPEELQDWKRANHYYYQDLKHAGVVLTSVGGGLFVAGTAMTVGGALMHYDFYERPGRLAGKVCLLVFGPIMGVTGLIVGLVGVPKFAQAGRLKRKAQGMGVDITYAPMIIPTTNTYGMSFAMRF